MAGFDFAEIVTLMATINKWSLLGLVVLTLGLVQVFKAFSQDELGVPDGYLPPVSLVIGVAISLLWSTITGVGLVEHLFIGLGFGLAASGLFDQNKWTKGLLEILMPNR